MEHPRISSTAKAIIILFALFAVLTCSALADFSTRVDAAYNQGVSDGYDKGYNAGFDDGYAAADSSTQVDESAVPTTSTVYITPSGQKFHRSSCPTTKHSNTTAISRADALADGYTACKRCHP